MTAYTPAPASPAGYRLVPEQHIDAIEHALMRRIRDLDTLLPGPVSWQGSQTCMGLIAQRDAAIAALRAINPTLAAIWTGEVRA